MKYTYELCKRICNLKREDISPEIMADVRYRTLDWAGCTIGALEKDCAKAVLNLISETGANGPCTAVGLQHKTFALYAAFSNGVISHKLEYDDTNKIAITHPGAVVIPVALAVAEAEGLSFGQYALGVVAGYEVMIRLGGALNPSHYDYWHTTGTCGAFAAVAAAGKLMGLDTTQLQTALGLAGTMASGLVCVFGTDAKLVNVGNAASRGIMAAQLAKRGFTAPLDIIENPKGYAAATSRENDLSFIAALPEGPLMIEDAYYKVYASCGHTHCALDALMDLMSKNSFTYEDVESIQVRAYSKAVELTRGFNNSTESKAKFSMPYCIAAGIVLGQVDLNAFSVDALNDSRIHKLAGKITVLDDEACNAAYPAVRTETVTIRLKDKELFAKVDLPDGHPPLQFLENKYLSLSTMVINEQNARRIMDCILDFKDDQAITGLGEVLRREIVYGM